MKKLLAVLWVVLGFSYTHLAFAGQVQLLRAQSYVSYAEGLSYQQPTIDALVTNLGYPKLVYAHVLTAGSVWVDIPLSFNRVVSSNLEIWTASRAAFNTLLGNQPLDLTFALKYVVNGKTYWDNNGGQNYFIAADSGSYLPSLNVYNGTFQPTVAVASGQTPWVYGTITVRNIAYAKQITVVYSTDNWVTTHTVGASYSAAYWQNAYSNASNPNQYGFEEWSFGFNPGTVSQVQYAIAYTVNGQTYWDNNFGNNYTTTLSY